MKKNIENSDMPISRPTMLAPRNVRSRKIENGIRGSFSRISITTKAIRSSTATARQAIVRVRPPADVDRVDDGIDEQRQPRGDGHRAGDVKGASGLLAAALEQMRGANAAAISPIGTLTKSTQRQLSPLVRMPPSSTPRGPTGAGAPRPRYPARGCAPRRRRTWW